MTPRFHAFGIFFFLRFLVKKQSSFHRFFPIFVFCTISLQHFIAFIATFISSFFSFVFDMATSKTTITNNLTPLDESNLVQKTNELQNIRVSYQINAKNYLKWSQFIRTYSQRKGNREYTKTSLSIVSLCIFKPPATSPHKFRYESSYHFNF